MELITSKEMYRALEVAYWLLIALGLLILFHREWKKECAAMYKLGRQDALGMKANGLNDSDVRSCLRVCASINKRQGPYEEGLISVLETK